MSVGIIAAMTKDQAIKWGGGTQVALAAKLGINQGSVSAWGEYPPPLQQLRIEALSKGALKAEKSCARKGKAK